MDYFKYVSNKSTVDSLEIYQMVLKYENLAKKKFKGHYEDALDDAYFHILDHYDSSKGSLESYVHRIVGTIYMNKFSREKNREVNSDDLFLDFEAYKQSSELDDTTNPIVIVEENDIEYSEVLDSCVRYLLPYFIKDYELFKSRDGSLRKVSYKGLFDKYSASVINDAVTLLSDKYYEDAKYISTLSKSCHVRNFTSDRYKSSIDKTISYICRIGDIVKCKSLGVKRKKYAYLLDVDDLLRKVFMMFYSSEGVGIRIIYGENVYCSLSGQIFFNKKELLEALERELVGSILSRKTNLKVLKYDRGNDIIFSSTNENEPRVILNMFNTGVYVPLSKLTMGRID